jgi:hypothetical protein
VPDEFFEHSPKVGPNDEYGNSGYLHVETPREIQDRRKRIDEKLKKYSE